MFIHKDLSADDALAEVAHLIDAIDSHGFAAVGLKGAMDHGERLPTALAALARDAGTASMIAETLVEKAFEAFQPVVRQFQKDMAAAMGTAATQTSALREFVSQFSEARAALFAWCRQLRAPEVAGAFATYVRCAVMQPDVLTGEEPRGRRELVLLLERHGRGLLRVGSAGDPPAGEADEEEEHPGDSPRRSSSGGARYVASLASDPVLRCLDELGMSGTRAMKRLWYGVLVSCIEERVGTLEEDYSEHCIRGYLDWEEEVVEPFVHVTLSRLDGAGPAESSPSAAAAAAGFSESAPRIHIGVTQQRQASDNRARAERDRWCTELRERLLVAYARRRTASFWDIMAEYPDSVPALEDLRFCLQACPHGSVKAELTSHLRALLANRLHRAGTRTEDILVMLSKAVNSLWVLVPRNEQSAVVFSVVSDTLDHLRRRKDCVPAVVQVLTQSGGDTALYHTYEDQVDGPFGAVAGAEDEEAEDSLLYGGGAAAAGAGGGGSSHERPDILRILLTAIPVRALTAEYQHALAQHLLGKPVHDFDTTPEEEVLERLKRVLGGDVMPDCEVMVHNIQSSKRTTNQLRERLAEASARAGIAAAATSLDVLSLTVWPKLGHCLPAGEPVPPPDRYACHSSLQREMDRLAEGYKSFKQGQKLVWMLSQGRITLDVKQRCGPAPDSELVTTPHTLSLFAASLLLFMFQLDTGEGVPVASLAARLDISVDALLPHLPRLIPNLLVVLGSDGAQPGPGTVVALQRVLSASSQVLFEEAGAQAECGKSGGADDLRKSSLDRDQLELLRTMALSMLQNVGTSSGPDIMNSMKMFTGISLSNADLRHLMHTLMADGSVILNDAKLYSIP